MSKDAVVYFSGGKDSVMAVWKARQMGYNIVAAINFRAEGFHMLQDTTLVEAVAARLGIFDIRYETMTYEPEPQQDSDRVNFRNDVDASKTRNDAIFNSLKADYPNLAYLIFSIDDVQPIETLFMRKAHAYGLTALNPYNMFYDREFFDDLIANNVELRMQFPKEDLVLAFYINGQLMNEEQSSFVKSKITYNCGDIIDLNELKSSYETAQNFSLYSMAQTIVTNANFFSSPVPTEVVSNRLGLKN